ncbi:MAG: methyltransferase domain-containing protein [Phycisphaerae bacterium]|nr:methyltransferase domain-containing protein [Phycisphaerae bacterium]
MIPHSEKDRCGRAHRDREAVNTAARKSLEDWALSIAPAGAGMSVLDLGCGTGKLAVPYAQAVGPTGSVLGVDISPESVAELQRKTRRKELTNLRVRVGNLDEIESILAGETFDLIVSSYAIYYASDMPGLLRALAGRLTAEGRVFVCGPGEGTNHEMDELVRKAAPERNGARPLDDFLSLDQIGFVSQSYAKVEQHRLENAVSFDTARTLLSWWRNHSMHIPQADPAVESAVRSYFETHKAFLLTKNVLGVLFCR